MEKATVYRAISAPTALVAGVLALAASWWGYHLDPRYSDVVRTEESRFTEYAFSLIWFSVLVLVSAANGYFLFRDARRREEKFISNGMKMALIALIPSHLTALALSIFFESAPSVLVLVWIVFHGIGLLATGHFSPRSIAVLGWAFLLAGLAVIAGHAYGPSSVPSQHTLMAVTFGGFHLIYAAFTWPRGAAKANA